MKFDSHVCPVSEHDFLEEIEKKVILRKLNLTFFFNLVAENLM